MYTWKSSLIDSIFINESHKLNICVIRATWMPYRNRVSETRFAKSETESQKLDFQIVVNDSPRGNHVWVPNIISHFLSGSYVFSRGFVWVSHTLKFSPLSLLFHSYNNLSTFAYPKC